MTVGVGLTHSIAACNQTFARIPRSHGRSNLLNYILISSHSCYLGAGAPGICPDSPENSTNMTAAPVAPSNALDSQIGCTRGGKADGLPVSVDLWHSTPQPQTQLEQESQLVKYDWWRRTGSEPLLIRTNRFRTGRFSVRIPG